MPWQWQPGRAGGQRTRFSVFVAQCSIAGSLDILDPSVSLGVTLLRAHSPLEVEIGLADVVAFILFTAAAAAQ